jgi:hypothetical protein
LAPQFFDDDGADAAVAADDEMVREIVQHALPPAAREARMNAAVHDDRGQQREV